MSLSVEMLVANLRFAMSMARANEPLSVDSRARAFVATLGGLIHAVDPQLGAELYSVLINLPAMKEAPCSVSQS